MQSLRKMPAVIHSSDIDMQKHVKYIISCWFETFPNTMTCSFFQGEIGILNSQSNSWAKGFESQRTEIALKNNLAFKRDTFEVDQTEQEVQEPQVKLS